MVNIVQSVLFAVSDQVKIFDRNVSGSHNT